MTAGNVSEIDGLTDSKTYQRDGLGFAYFTVTPRAFHDLAEA